MREFKFRAWHREAREMFLENYPGGVFQWLRDKQPVVIMQWTGLLDKNGKEVFEGDIVRATLVMYDPGRTWMDEVEWNDEFACFWLKREREMDWMKLECEILGNIYEHGELLNGKQ